MQVHSNARAAGCYTLVDTRFFYDDVIDPSIVRDIHVFEPCYVPLLCKKIYLTPAGTTIEKQYHVVGRYIENPTEGYENANVKLEGKIPDRWYAKRKKIQALRILQGKWPGPGDEGGPSVEWKLAMPAPEVRVGRWLVEQLAAVQKFFDVGAELNEEDGKLTQTGTVASTIDRLNAIVNAEAERDTKIEKEAMVEARLRMRENWPAMKKAMDEGRWAPKPEEPKVTVDYGHRAALEPPKEIKS